MVAGGGFQFEVNLSIADTGKEIILFEKTDIVDSISFKGPNFVVINKTQIKLTSDQYLLFYYFLLKLTRGILIPNFFLFAILYHLYSTMFSDVKNVRELSSVIVRKEALTTTDVVIINVLIIESTNQKKSCYQRSVSC
jgi:hypothetical protein